MIGVGTFKTTEKARKYINQVLDSERLSYGPFTQKFESVFAAAHDCRFAIMTNSGTCCLMVALAALKEKYGWADGDEVIVPAVTFIATSNIVLQLNMTPVFVDVEPDCYGIDPTKIEAAITSKTRCIIPVHLFGMPCDMDPIMEIARKHNLRVIEDSCETMFVKYKGRAVGSFGDVGCFSTYVAHILVTGVGGLCTVNDPELAVSIRSIVNHGRDSIYLNIDDDKNKSEGELRMIISRRFKFVRMGYSFRPTEFEGALGLAEFERHDEMMKARKFNGAYFMKHLAPLSEYLQLPKIREGADHAFMMFPIVMKHETKEEIVNYLEQHGIETREMLPLINQPYYKKIFNIKEEDYPASDWINKSGFYIASHQGLTQADREHIVNTFMAYFAHKAISQEESTLIIMSNLEQRDFNELQVQSFYERLPLDRFEQYILADGAVNGMLEKYFSKRGFQVIQERAPKGKLLKSAVTASTNENIVVIGIDGTDNVEDIDSILNSLKTGSRITVASRFIHGGRRAPKGFITHRSFANRLFAFLASTIFQQNISDANNLFRGFKRSLFLGLDLSEDNNDVMFEFTTSALANDIEIKEIPTKENQVIFAITKRNRFISALNFCSILLRSYFKPKSTNITEGPIGKSLDMAVDLSQKDQKEKAVGNY